MNVETTTEATTIPATRTTHVATISAADVHHMAAEAAFRRLCLLANRDTKAVSVTNTDGSVTVTMVVVTPDA